MLGEPPYIDHIQPTSYLITFDVLEEGKYKSI